MGSKSDKGDSAVLANVLRTDMHAPPPLVKPAAPLVRSWRGCCRYRRSPEGFPQRLRLTVVCSPATVSSPVRLLTTAAVWVS
jgi:hypothetical protein